jgi:hypothetical protein
MLNFFNNIYKNNNEDKDKDVKEHYAIPWSKYKHNENDPIYTTLFVLIIVSSVLAAGMEWWNNRKQQNLIKTNNVVNGSVPVSSVSSVSPTTSVSR